MDILTEYGLSARTSIAVQGQQAVLSYVLWALESDKTCFKTGLYFLLSLIFFICKMVLLEIIYCDDKTNEWMSFGSYIKGVH